MAFDRSIAFARLALEPAAVEDLDRTAAIGNEAVFLELAGDPR